MKFFAMLALAALAFVGGCGGLNVTDQQLAQDVNLIAYNGSYYGLKAVLSNNPGRGAVIVKDVTTATDLIQRNVLNKFLGGAPTSAMFMSMVTDLETAFQAQLAPATADVINVGLSLIQAQLVLPANPSTTLDARTLGALTSGFQGLVNGLNQAAKEFTPPSATMRLAPAHLVNHWTTK
jgi:hypothetical protein